MSKASQPKVWFITGASRGFGLDTARAALERGDSVVATARRPETIEAALGKHDRLYAVALDVTDERQAQAAAELAIARFGRIDVLLNNAGYGLLGAVEEADAQETQAQFATNVFGLLNVTRAVLPHMRREGSGHVINVSSIGGFSAYPGWGVYGATKFAVEGITEALALELAPLGIHATTVQPGFFRTDFLDSTSLVKTAREIADYAATVGAMRGLMEGANHQQPGDPKKFAQAMLLLADSPKPPVHLPLGSDTVARLGDKQRDVMAELGAWREVAHSTDHEDVKR
jgi:NAD(P)-dependent dehydrogenase (short-subunit alcohol dehydrogenase family)